MILKNFSFKFVNNAAFGKTMENVRKHRDIKLFSIRTNLSFYKVFQITSISNRNEKNKTEILMNKPVYLGLSILELRKILMHQFWYDYVKPKYGKKAKLCYMDRDSSNT